MQRSKRYFTLLEIMLCLVLITLVGSLVSIKLYSLVNHHRFSHSVERLYTLIKETQALALTHQCDFEWEIKKVKEQFLFQCKTGNPQNFPELLQEEVLSCTSKIQWDSTNTNLVKLHVFPDGRIEPKGLLSLHTKEDTQILWIDLKRPLLVKISNKKPKTVDCTLPAKPKIEKSQRLSVD